MYLCMARRCSCNTVFTYGIETRISIIYDCVQYCTFISYLQPSRRQGRPLILVRKHIVLCLNLWNLFCSPRWMRKLWARGEQIVFPTFLRNIAHSTISGFILSRLLCTLWMKTIKCCCTSHPPTVTDTQRNFTANFFNLTMSIPGEISLTMKLKSLFLSFCIELEE